MRKNSFSTLSHQNYMIPTTLCSGCVLTTDIKANKQLSLQPNGSQLRDPS